MIRYAYPPVTSLQLLLACLVGSSGRGEEVRLIKIEDLEVKELKCSVHSAGSGRGDINGDGDSDSGADDGGDGYRNYTEPVNYRMEW